MSDIKYIRTLRENGLKSTPQRIEVLKFLSANRIHPTPDMLHEALLKKFPSVSRMTVYNIIDTFIKKNIIKGIRFAHSTQLHVDLNDKKHYHFICNDCKTIYDIEYDHDFDDLISKNGHKVDDLRLKMYGTCSNCLNCTGRSGVSSV